MQKSPLTAILLTVLLVNVLATAVLAFSYIWQMREAQRLQLQINSINQTRNLVQALANEAVEYSKRNPGIDPLLQSVGLKAPKSSPAPAPAKPTGK